jgi:fluoroquinolone resistance protein
MVALDTAQLKAMLAAGTPIAGATCEGVDWSDLDAEAAVFTDCLFQAAHFANSNFGGARFIRCRFPRARFSRADLKDCGFEDCVFVERSKETVGCTFMLSELRQARFARCDLSFATFERSDMFAIEMDPCNLRGTRFEKADFSHAYGRKIVRSRGAFRNCNLELADLTETRLADCDFSGSRLREADFTAADLTDSVLRDCDLFQTVLTGTKLDGADLRGAEISGLKLLHLASFARMKITQSQQHILLDGIGVDVHAEPG